MALETPLIHRLLPANRLGSRQRTTILVLAGVTLLTASAWLQLPTGIVKVSLQSLMAVLIGLAFGSRLGTGTFLAYMGLGAAGAPVFQSGAGLAYLAGPTGGFLVGTLAATWLAGRLAERGALKSSVGAGAATVASLIAVFVPGVAWLAVLFGPAESLALGLYPFIPAELIKIGLAVGLAPLLRRLNSRLS
ncbi:MAG TPA: biotin transporter BioY [Deinococcales bacterium]|nr:biotin transporter BioY [Deinococcales bacterium]